MSNNNYIKEIQTNQYCQLKDVTLSNDYLFHAFFGRIGGVSSGVYESLNCGLNSGDDTDKIMTNLDIVLNKVNEVYQNATAFNSIVLMKQIHSNIVVTYNRDKIKGDKVQVIPDADSIITNESGVLLAIQTADCLPLLMYDKNFTYIAAVHCGWRGSVDSIIQNTVDKLEELSGKEIRQNLTALIGPCIAQKSYEVDEIFYDKLLTQNDNNKRFFKTLNISKEVKEKGDSVTFLFNLAEYCRHILEDILNINRIYEVDLDTYEYDNLFFSCRWSKHHSTPDNSMKFGRQLSLIGIPKNSR